MDIQQIQEELYPRIFFQAENLFPEFGFRRTGKGFIATAGASFDGTQGKAQGKINYLETSPAVMFDNRAGKTRNVIKYIQEREQLPTYIDALRYCAKAVNFSFEDETFSNGKSIDVAQTLEQDYLKRQAFEEIQRVFVEHLWHSNDNRAFRYLQNRGYSNDDIRAMGCGYALPFHKIQQHLRSLGYLDETIHSLGLQSAVPERFDHQNTVHNLGHNADIIEADYSESRKGNTSYLASSHSQQWHAIGETYIVSFPMRDAVGRLHGFIFRADVVRKNEAGKDCYPKYLFSKNVSKSVPVGFNHTLRQKHIVAVEGIVDALFLQARGINNVIAVGGKHLTEEQLKTLERYSIRSITLAFDDDVEGKRGILESIEKIRRTALTFPRTMALWKIYVFKEGALKDTKDPDEFVRCFGIEAFQRALEHDIETSEECIAREIAGDLLSETNASIPPKRRDALLERAWEYTKLLRSPIEEEIFIQSLSNYTGIRPGVLQATSTFATEYFRQEQERMYARRVLSNALEMIHQQKPMADIQSAVKNYIASSYNNAALLPSYSLQAFLQDIRTAPDGLQTGYPELDASLRLSQNGVTIIAARPSHGKTSFKMNLLLNLLQLYPKKTFCFFSYEEPVKIIALKLLNILAGVRFQGQQLPDLLQYLRNDHTITNHAGKIEAVESAKQTLGQYLESGRLRIVGEKISPLGIRQMVEEINTHESVGAVFVDYIQKVKPASGKFSTRQLELQDVSASLHSIAVEMNTPMIVGAQFNREVRTESDVREDCLREAGDLEQDANVVLALWNPAKTEQDDTSIQAQLGTTDVRRVELKVKTLKNRDGAVNLKGVALEYDMPLSTIRSIR